MTYEEAYRKIKKPEALINEVKKWYKHGFISKSR